MQILIKPIITEKISKLNEVGKYGFIVDRRANKVQIKKEIENIYGVTVDSINTMIQYGKKKRKYSKSKVIVGHTQSFKKAIVQLAEGDLIDFFSEV